MVAAGAVCAGNCLHRLVLLARSDLHIDECRSCILNDPLSRLNCPPQKYPLSTSWITLTHRLPIRQVRLISRSHMSQHSHDFPHWPFQATVDTVTYCTAKVAREHFPVLQVVHDHDGDWQFLDATTDEPGEAVLLCFGCVYERDATLADISDLPPGWGAFREEVGAAWERWENPPDEDEGEEKGSDGHHCSSAEDGEAKALADIAQYGLHVISVLEEDELPPFTYSIGITQSLGLPELIVIGLKSGIAHSAINECYRQMKDGGVLAPGSRVSGLLGGEFQCLIGEVDPVHFKEYMGWALWLNKGSNFKALQVIFPSTSNVFPWEPEANEWFRNRQPLLAERLVD